MRVKLLFLSLVALVCAAFGVSAQPVKVACVGNSITYGFLLADPATEAYPARLAELLGSDYEVGNFGNSGTTLLRHGHKPYVKVPEYQSSLDFQPDVVLIHLGVNDTDPRNWPYFADEFVSDYLDLIADYRRVNPNVRVILSSLTPLGAGHWRFETGTRDWRREINDAIATVARLSHSELMDLGAQLLDRPELIPEDIHPNAEGARLMAEEAYAVITGRRGGVQLLPIYGSDMVLQRHKPIRIAGIADVGTPVTVTLAGDSASAVADSNGRWVVTLPPRTAQRGLTLTVAALDSVITLDNVAVGEVWIASGQSNMEFELRQAADRPANIPADPDLRFFSMRGFPTNAVRWSDSIQNEVNNLRYYPANTRWEGVDADNAGELSAVAYFFARELRDSLQVPVGIIANAVGGSTTEAWIDIETLWDEMPGALRNYRNNDYLQPWARKRIVENSGTSPANRHPYEPSYLFTTVIRPLGQLPVAGVIWYQGESNAHNALLHERLFPMLEKSWRKSLNAPRLPFYFVQLSSLWRTEWPRFRDSQRQLASRLPFTAMAVSSDVGDSLDVHPRRKLPVGQRLSRLALRNTYGYDLTASGPEPISLEALNDTLIISMANAEGMHPAGGSELLTFEVASIPGGVYFPAKASVHGSEIHVYSMNVKNPQSVRYGWQPFTRANLVNSNELPASTFHLDLESTPDPDLCFDEGVSGCFSGTLPDGTVVVAGGCNFPGDPFAPTATKKFYSGIYALQPDSAVALKLIGRLAQPTAYGASASTPRGVVMAGGSNASGQLSAVVLLEPNAALTELPSLPQPIDNAAAAAIGNTVYVAGGTVDGNPSNALWSLNLDDLKKGWQRLADFPGSPRVQPVMAATDGALYLWSGFSPRTADAEPTLSTDGLRYDPRRKRWAPLAGPTEPDGTPLSLAGGTALTLPDGRIMVTGGVNAEIFLNAIRHQAPDYLAHPVSWYRFNPWPCVFNPADGSWTLLPPADEAARAGASMQPTAHGTIIIFGGELKPRLRSTRVAEIKNY